MNCPAHCLIFKSSKRSRKELPLRLAEFSPLHRNELAAFTQGSRVRCFHQTMHIYSARAPPRGGVAAVEGRGGGAGAGRGRGQRRGCECECECECGRAAAGGGGELLAARVGALWAVRL